MNQNGPGGARTPRDQDPDHQEIRAMCSLLSRAVQRKCRKIHDADQRRAGAARYHERAELYRRQAKEFRRRGNPAGAAHLDDQAADCEVVAGDILAGRRKP